MIEDNKLKPCPFCGSTNVRAGGDDKVVGVWCQNCEASGPNGYLTINGNHDWNTRAQLESARRVKPLVWSKFEHDPTEQEYVSLTLVGKYFIGFGMAKGKRYVEYNGEALANERGVIWFDYLKEAQAAAEADFQRRYDSMSDPTPQPEPVNAAALESIVDTIEDIISETHEIDVKDRNYAENIVSWMEVHNPTALRALTGESKS